MKINKYWVLAIIGLFILIVGSAVSMTTHSGTTANSNKTSTQEKKDTDKQYAQKKFDKIQQLSKEHKNVLVILYEPGKPYTSEFLNMVKNAKNSIKYSGSPEVVYIKGSSFIKNWEELGYASKSGTVTNTKALMKTNILALNKDTDINNLANYRFYWDQENNSNKSISAPTGGFGFLKDDSFESDSGVYNNELLNEITTNDNAKRSVQEHLINFAFSWFNDDLYHRN